MVGIGGNMDFMKTSTHLQGQTKCPFFKIADEIGIASWADWDFHHLGRNIDSTECN